MDKYGYREGIFLMSEVVGNVAVNAFLSTHICLQPLTILNSRYVKKGKTLESQNPGITPRMPQTQ
eukprot:5004457-Amphidinium_carterae.1